METRPADIPQPPYSPDGLRAIRESFGMTGPQFARLLSRPGAEIHRNTWRKWELGEQEPPAVAQCLIAMLLHMRERAPEALDAWIAAGSS
ncbi:MAG: hypothetical protein WC247_12275 [Porticoccaceae bacterium]